MFVILLQHFTAGGREGGGVMGNFLYIVLAVVAAAVVICHVNGDVCMYR